jgi:hypothetical protein
MLAPEDAQRIDAIRSAGAAAGDWVRAQEAAWSALPAPRHGWGYHSQSIAGGLFRAAVDGGALEAAAFWHAAHKAALGAPNDPGLALDGAELALARGDRAAAETAVAALFKAFGRRPFAGRHPRLLGLLGGTDP